MSFGTYIFHTKANNILFACFHINFIETKNKTHKNISEKLMKGFHIIICFQRR